MCEANRFTYLSEFTFRTGSPRAGVLISCVVDIGMSDNTMTVVVSPEELMKRTGMNEATLRDAVKNAIKQIDMSKGPEGCILFKLDSNPITKKIITQQFDKRIGKTNAQTMKTVMRDRELPFGEKFRQYWVLWLEYRKEIKKQYRSAKGVKTMLTRLQKFDEDYACEMITNAISNNYQGLIFKDSYDKYIKAKKQIAGPDSESKKQGVGQTGVDGF